MIITNHPMFLKQNLLLPNGFKMFILFKTSYVKSKLGRTVANICACISKHLMLKANPVVKAIFNKYTKFQNIIC